MTLTIGSILEKRYTIEKKLGEGGFGAVYLAADSRLKVRCAVKESLQTSQEATRQFRREAEMLAKLRHPNLPRVTDYFDTPNGLHLVMDFIEGDDLGALLEKNGRPFPVDQALTWISQICDALIYIHGQTPPIIHRDIKPANIRITPQGNAVLVDFGLAKIFEGSVKTSTGARGLTPHFAAPEQYGTGGTDAQSDIYSLGVTLYCMLTFRVPSDSLEILLGNANPSPFAKEVNENISDPVSKTIQHAMQIRRTDRYKSAGDFKTALLAKQKPFAQVKVVESPAIQLTNLINNKFTLSNGMEFMRVPAGKFFMGSNEDGYDERPLHKVDIPYDYWIGRFPITYTQYKQFNKNHSDRLPRHLHKYGENHPAVDVGWKEVMKYSQWLNNLFRAELPSGMVVRLPTEAEWEKAARGVDGREFPWGNTFDKNKCNSQESGIEGTTPVGLFPVGDSPYGCADMAGNIWEWTHSEYKPYPYNAADGREDEQKDVTRVLRGGGYDQDGYYMRCAFRDDAEWSVGGLFQTRKSLNRGITNVGRGFRVVVSVPTPISYTDSIALPENQGENSGLDDESMERIYRKHLSINPNSVHTYHHFGNFLYEKNRLKEAEEAYRNAIKVDQDMVNSLVLVYCDLGLLLEGQNRVKEAEESYRKAIQTDDTFAAFAYNYLGRLLAGQNRVKEAEEAYQDAISNLPSYFDAYNNLGLLLAEQNRVKEAEEVYRKAIAIDANNLESWGNLGLLLQRQNSEKEFEESIHCFDKVLEINPREAFAWFSKGFSLNELKRYEEAIRCFDRVLEIDPHDKYASSNKAFSVQCLQELHED